MKIETIINELCNSEISKYKAIEQLTKITDGLRKNNALTFTVTSVAFQCETNHGILHLELPYQYSKIEGKIKKGDKVDVIILP